MPFTPKPNPFCAKSHLFPVSLFTKYVHILRFQKERECMIFQQNNTNTIKKYPLKAIRNRVKGIILGQHSTYIYYYYSVLWT